MEHHYIELLVVVLLRAPLLTKTLSLGTFEVSELLVLSKEDASCLRELKLGLPKPALNITSFLLSQF